MNPRKSDVDDFYEVEFGFQQPAVERFVFVENFRQCRNGEGYVCHLVISDEDSVTCKRHRKISL